MRAYLTSILATLFLAPALWAQEAPCNADAPCEIDGGSYHMIIPEAWDGESPLPALVFFHGHRGSGKGIFRSRGLRETFLENGYLLIAPNGAIREGTNYRAWPARPGSPRDDVDFTLRVMDDIATRLPLQADQIYASGFSAGGSMAWMMGCYAGDRFAGIASVAGALRRPHPGETCPAPSPSLIQIHGFADGQVPLEGRGIRDWHQGDVFESLSLLRRSNGCRSNPDQIEIGERFRSRTWTTCDTGHQQLSMHDGGHGLPRGWTDLARDFFEREE
jgi:polyhydroxybutyrate depolymerase